MKDFASTTYAPKPTCARLSVGAASSCDYVPAQLQSQVMSLPEMAQMKCRATLLRSTSFLETLASQRSAVESSVPSFDEASSCLPGSSQGTSQKRLLAGSSRSISGSGSANASFSSAMGSGFFTRLSSSLNVSLTTPKSPSRTQAPRAAGQPYEEGAMKRLFLTHRYALQPCLCGTAEGASKAATISQPGTKIKP